MRVRTAKLGGLKFKERDDDESGEVAEFEGYLSVFGNLDLGGDVVQKGAFSKTLKDQDEFPLLWQHWPDAPVGTFTANEDEKGLRISGILVLAVEKAREAYALMKARAVKGLSIGYDVVKETQEDGKNLLHELKLFEGSIVTFPMNELATVDEVKSQQINGALESIQTARAEIENTACAMRQMFEKGALPQYVKALLPLAPEDRAWDASAAESRVRTWASADDGPNAQYKRAFFYAPASAETFGDCKLPFADVIDGTLTAVPRGVYAAAGAVQGARGGVSIPEEAVAGVKAQIAAYYSKLDKEPPWSSDSGSSDDEKQLKDLIGTLDISDRKEGRVLSGKNRKLITEAVASLNALLEATEPGEKSTRRAGEPHGNEDESAEPGTHSEAEIFAGMVDDVRERMSLE